MARVSGQDLVSGWVVGWLAALGGALHVPGASGRREGLGKGLRAISRMSGPLGL